MVQFHGHQTSCQQVTLNMTWATPPSSSLWHKKVDAHILYTFDTTGAISALSYPMKTNVPNICESGEILSGEESGFSLMPRSVTKKRLNFATNLFQHPIVHRSCLHCLSQSAGHPGIDSKRGTCKQMSGYLKPKKLISKIVCSCNITRCVLVAL